MATDYLERNRKVLNELKERDPVKYRSLKLYLECQNIYDEALERGVREVEAWDRAAAHWNAWAEKLLAERQKLEESGEWQVGKDIWGVDCRKKSINAGLARRRQGGFFLCPLSPGKRRGRCR